jgi:uncharacterized protein YegL
MAEEKAKEEARITEPLRPTRTHISSMEELGILVLDGSQSMSGAENPEDADSMTKAEAVGKAVRGLIQRVKDSTRAHEISLAFIAFDNEVQVRLQPTPVTEIDLEVFNTDPYLGGSTAIGDALYEAGKIADEFLSRVGTLPRMVVLMLMSDGQNMLGRNPLEAANELKGKLGERLIIHCAAYGPDADQGTLKQICTKPDSKNFTLTHDAETLRSAFTGSLLSPKL